MSEGGTEQSSDAVVVELDETLYPKDAIYGAAYVFMDRCYVKLERLGPGRIAVRFKPKAGVTVAPAELTGQLENELLSQAWRRLLIDENRRLVETVTTHALAGAAGPPGLDDLLDLDVDEQSAFDDPLGIAMSWEDKYKKRPAKPEGEGEP
jgi:His-Xaa-Ser system protein HxsD